MSRAEFDARFPDRAACARYLAAKAAGGRLTAAQAYLAYEAGAYPGSPVGPGAMCAFACYDLENVKAVGYDVVCNRPKQAAYRAPGT